MKKIIIGNWKMNPLTLKDAGKLFSSVTKGIYGIKKTDVVICPPVLYIERLKKLSKKISLGAQDAFWGEVGPFTGQISAHMLYNAGIRYVILGHSERRELSETSHGDFNLVKNQLEECLNGVSKNSISKVIVMYEPVWAISSTANRRDATSGDCREMAIFIRKILSDKFGGEVANVRIIYGGSVSGKNAEDFLKNGGVDGLLPGRASLDAKKFVEIIKIAEKI